MAKPIIVLGTGGNSIDILETIQELNARAPAPIYECLGFLDDDPSGQARQVEGLSVLGSLPDAPRFTGAVFANGTGSALNFWRRPEIVGRTTLGLDRFETIIHPTSSISRSARIGRGTVILQNATVASHAVIGLQSMVLPQSIISHDCVIGDYTMVAGGACVSGGVEIGRCCYVGTNSSIIGNVRLGDECLVGMGAVVIEGAGSNVVLAGNPAKVLRPTRGEA